MEGCETRFSRGVGTKLIVTCLRFVSCPHSLARPNELDKGIEDFDGRPIRGGHHANSSNTFTVQVQIRTSASQRQCFSSFPSNSRISQRVRGRRCLPRYSKRSLGRT